MKYNTPETQYAKRYETDYHQTYGQQRMNTGYNFDSETKELITDNIFDNLVVLVPQDFHIILFLENLISFSHTYFSIFFPSYFLYNYPIS